MLSDFWNFLMGNIGQGATGGQTATPPTPAPTPQPYGNPMPGQYGPPMPQSSTNPVQGQDLRQQAILKMLQQGMLGQGGQGQPQGPQVPPMQLPMGGRPTMAPNAEMPTAASALMQRMQPGMMQRKPLGMM